MAPGGNDAVFHIKTWTARLDDDHYNLGTGGNSILFGSSTAVFSHFVRYQRHWNRGVVSAITFSTSYIFLQNGSAESYETNAQSFQLLTFDIVRIIGV